MAENTILSRIQLKYDTLLNWNASTFILKRGEVAIALYNMVVKQETEQAAAEAEKKAQEEKAQKEAAEKTPKNFGQF